MTQPIVVSVNIGKPEHVEGHTALTGICKTPALFGEIGTLGVAGDAVLDRKHHGGPDQAVYLYLQSDYDWWAGELGEALPPGIFGENLTIAGIAGDRLSVGDRLTIGDVLLELTMHRTPCNTFAARMGDRKWVRRFHNAGRPGAYARVLVPGSVRAGDRVDYRPFVGTPVYVSELMALDGQRQIDAATLRRALAAPIHYKMRADFEQRLAQLDLQ
jgi:MOSC domain-containing protein YiiM